MSGAIAPFPRRPIPVLGESIYGFERRFAACTRYESLGSFREATGLLEVVPGSVQTKFARLAILAGLGPNDLDFMRWTGRDGIRRGYSSTFLGHLIHAGYLRTQKLRFCPTCLGEGGPPEQRIHHQAWQILQVCACPRHRTLLVEACDVCGEAIEQALKTKAWTCKCGRDMTEMATTAAPKGAIAMSAAIMQCLPLGCLVGFDPAHGLPEPFDALDLDSFLTIVSKIGILASASAEEDSPAGPSEKPYSGVALRTDLSCSETARVMDAADRIIRDWPKGMESLFSTIADRNPNPCDDHPVRSIFSTRTGYRLLGRIKSADGETIGVIEGALENWLLRERGIYIDGRQRPKVGVAGDVAIDMADALRRLEGRSGHPLGIRSWVAAGTVNLVGNYVSLSSVEATVEAIAHLACSEFGDGMSVEDWSTRFLYHHHYKRCDAIRDVLSGKIRVRRRPSSESRTGLDSIEISSDDFLCCTREAAILAKTENRSVFRRAERARKTDGFCRPGQLYALLAARWPGCPIFDVTEEAAVRCRTDVRRYYGRTMRQKLYSIVDALNVMEQRYQSLI